MKISVAEQKLGTLGTDNSRIPRAGVRGFTLIESVVAISIFGVMVIALYGALTSGFNTVQLGREDMRATQILVKKMDQLRLFNWDQITNGTSIPDSFFAAFNPEDPDPTTNMTNGGGMGGGKGKGNGHHTIIPLVYSGTVTISAFPDNSPAYNPDMRQVKIQLDWNSASGMPRSRSLTTFVSHYGLQQYIY